MRNFKKMATILSNITEFAYDDENRTTAASRWAEWIEEFDLYLVAFGVTDGGRQKALLLHAAGKVVRSIYRTVAEQNDDLAAMKAKLKAHEEMLHLSNICLGSLGRGRPSRLRTTRCA